MFNNKAKINKIENNVDNIMAKYLIVFKVCFIDYTRIKFKGNIGITNSKEANSYLAKEL